MKQPNDTVDSADVSVRNIVDTALFLLSFFHLSNDKTHG